MQSAGFLPAALDTELPARPVRARTSRGATGAAPAVSPDSTGRRAAAGRRVRVQRYGYNRLRFS